MVAVDTAGAVEVGVPRSKPGDWIELKAEMDLLCGLTACSAEGSNNGSFKPIDYCVVDTALPSKVEDQTISSGALTS